jgi:hypothetical protein
VRLAAEIEKGTEPEGLTPEQRLLFREESRLNRVIRVLREVAIETYEPLETESAEEYSARISKLVGTWVSSHLEIAVPEGQDAFETVRQVTRDMVQEKLFKASGASIDQAASDKEDENPEDPYASDEGTQDEAADALANTAQDEDFSSADADNEGMEKKNNDDAKMSAFINDPDAKLFRFVFSKVLGIGISDSLGIIGYIFNPAHRDPSSAVGEPMLKDIPFPPLGVPKEEAEKHYSYSQESYLAYIKTKKQTVIERALAITLIVFKFDEFIELARKLSLQNFEFPKFSKVGEEWSSAIVNRDGLGSALYNTVKWAAKQNLQVDAQRSAFLRDFANTFTYVTEGKALPSKHCD